MPTPTPTELATRLATQLAKDLALEATAFKHLSDADRKAVEYRVCFTSSVGQFLKSVRFKPSSNLWAMPEEMTTTLL
jgi:hypothetical protein